MKGVKVWLKQNLSSLPNWIRFHMGGRFTDDAVLHLALVFAILTSRIQSGNHLVVDGKLDVETGRCRTQTVVTWFIAHLENNLGLPPAQ
jgi:hypothetical protein